MTDAGIAPPSFNARIMALRFLLGTTCKREEMQQHISSDGSHDDCPLS